MEIQNIKCISLESSTHPICWSKGLKNIFFCWRQVFVTDKKKKSYGLKDKPNSIKKRLTQELKAIDLGE
jgi:hypothetical protein